MHHCHISIFISYRGSASPLRSIHAHSLPSRWAQNAPAHTLLLINTHVRSRGRSRPLPRLLWLSLRPSSQIHYHVRRHSSLKGQIKWNLGNLAPCGRSCRNHFTEQIAFRRRDQTLLMQSNHTRSCFPKQSSSKVICRCGKDLLKNKTTPPPLYHPRNWVFLFRFSPSPSMSNETGHKVASLYYAGLERSIMRGGVHFNFKTIVP